MAPHAVTQRLFEIAQQRLGPGQIPRLVARENHHEDDEIRFKGSNLVLSVEGSGLVWIENGPLFWCRTLDIESLSFEKRANIVVEKAESWLDLGW